MDDTASKTASTPVPQTLENLLTAAECCNRLDISKSTWWGWVSRGVAPKPIKLGGKSRWPESDLIQMLADAFADREAA